MPAQKPHRSRQDYETPAELLVAVKRRFGVEWFDYDLAASALNAKARFYFSEREDSLQQDWAELCGELWLNPPFGRIRPWASKCADTARTWMTWRKDSVILRGTHFGRIFFLVPASVGSEWFARHCHGQSLVLALRGRLTYVGETAPYPKDNVLCVYGEPPGFEVWDWRVDAEGT